MFPGQDKLDYGGTVLLIASNFPHFNISDLLLSNKNLRWSFIALDHVLSFTSVPKN
jgi:hypothetical protein